MEIINASLGLTRLEGGMNVLDIKKYLIEKLDMKSKDIKYLYRDELEILIISTIPFKINITINVENAKNDVDYYWNEALEYYPGKIRENFNKKVNETKLIYYLQTQFYNYNVQKAVSYLFMDSMMTGIIRQDMVFKDIIFNAKLYGIRYDFFIIKEKEIDILTNNEIIVNEFRTFVPNFLYSYKKELNNVTIYEKIKNETNLAEYCIKTNTEFI